MKAEWQVYWLVYANHLFKNSLEFIQSQSVSIESQFDVMQLCFGRGRLENLWPKDVCVYVTGTEPVDYLLCSAYIEAISGRAREIIEQVAPGEVEFLPLAVMNKDGTPYTRMDYWAINVLPVVDALDWDNTQWGSRIPPPQDAPRDELVYIKPSFKAEKIEGVNFFRFEVAGEIRPGFYLSHSLKQALEKAGCKINMQFTPIRTT